jgi:hypothetical protein
VHVGGYQEMHWSQMDPGLSVLGMKRETVDQVGE